MRIILTTVLCLGLLAGCKSSHSKDLDQYAIEYSIENNQFGVVIAEDDGISNRDARKYALEKAAQVAHEHGYHYFIIDREGEVLMTKSADTSYGRDMPKNMYYSMIQSDNFGKDQMESSNLSPTQQVTGYRIEFSCYEEKPSSGRYFNVCDYGVCK